MKYGKILLILIVIVMVGNLLYVTMSNTTFQALAFDDEKPEEITSITVGASVVERKEITDEQTVEDFVSFLSTLELRKSHTFDEFVSDQYADEGIDVTLWKDNKRALELSFDNHGLVRILNFENEEQGEYYIKTDRYFESLKLFLDINNTRD
ncbi:hypothetical protein [Tenuibacillus multivorans]|uniref:Uncharacterized protein n=1 Tax=Tenuibacillus multivorans TaxID=237069 RepID=A0A1H0DGK7_9BACI|nr:hypothetical protein [Tenuibacillus multivorans]GEL76558.1 hypothetical protein TMU01_07930 [Tenuibacillus multivorans]SDN69387.1 hypothetical protein SAMN05216498_2868 [Tenuibacillus multivorans]